MKKINVNHKQNIKKSIIRFLLFTCILILFPHAQCDGYLSLFHKISGATPHAWSFRFGGTSDDEAYGLAVDSGGNIIITGYVTAAVDFNNDGDTDDSEEISYGSKDIAIFKMSASGDFIWGKRLGGTGDDIGNSATVDNNDNIIITGSIIGDADLNGNRDTVDDAETSTGTYGSTDVFIVKLDSSGNNLWAKRLGGTGSDEGLGVTTDGSTTVVVNGTITGHADLNGDGDSGDPIDGSAETGGSPYGNTDIFISLFDTTGTYSNSIRLGGINAIGDISSAVTLDTANTLIVSGTVALNADLDGDRGIGATPETAAIGYGLFDVFITSFDPVTPWSKRLGGSNGDLGYAVATDSGNNVIVTGIVNGNADLNGNGNAIEGTEDVTLSTIYANNDIFISKFDSTGNTNTCWFKRLGGTQNDGGSYYGKSITTDNAGNVIIAGEATGAADLNGNNNITDGLAETAASPIYSGLDIFISKFDPSGNWLWSKRFGGLGTDDAGSVIAGSTTTILTGSITGNADLDGDSTITPASAEEATGFGGMDIFIYVFVD